MAKIKRGARQNEGKNRKLPNVFNKQQLTELFTVIEETDIFMASLMALFCGLRIGEICALRKEHIDLQSGRVKIVQGKGAKDRYVMLPSTINNIVDKWMRLTDCDFFIPTLSQHGVSEGLLAQKFRSYLKKANLLIDSFVTTHGQQRHLYSFHTLRHTYATYLLEKGVDLYYIQRSLGHSDIYTTQIYAYISQKDLKEKIEKAFNGKNKTVSAEVSDPFTVLKIRFANGELSVDEFKEKFETLQKLPTAIY